MTIEEALKSLISIYSKRTLDQKSLSQLEADFAKLINQQLLATSYKKEDIEINYQKLEILFHPNHLKDFTDDVRWLNEKMAFDNKKDACFQIVKLCYEKLVEPQKFKPVKFRDIKSKEDCRKWLEERRDEATTHTARNFCISLIDLFDQSVSFFDETGRIRPAGLRTLVAFIPMTLSAYGAFIFAEELLIIYVLYIVLLKSGKFFGASDSLLLKGFGNILQNLSFSGALTTAALITRLLQMTFWASNQCLYLSLEAGNALLSPILSPKNKKIREPYTPENLRRDLTLASESKMEGYQFKTPELQVAAAPLQAYIVLNKQHYLQDYRAGRAKRLMISAILFEIEVLDKQDITILDKLNGAKKALEKRKKDNAPQVYAPGSETLDALEQTEEVIKLLIEQNQDVSLIKNNAP